MRNKIWLLALIIPLLAGCVSFNSGTVKNDGGIYKSVDSGEIWAQKVAIPEIGGRVVGMPNVNVQAIEIDPQDHNAIYVGTEADGLFYTYDAGERWRHATPTFASGSVTSIAVDYFNKCVVYATTANKIYKTEDCLRTWKQIYFDTVEETIMNTVKTESYNKNVLWAGNSRGDVLKSIDFGQNWTTINRLKSQVKQIIIDGKDTRIVYVATLKDGVFKTMDGGENWIDLSVGLKQFKDGKSYKFLVQDTQQSETLIFATKYGLLKTVNGGETWEALKLITPPGGSNILSVAVDPAKSQNIYYGTDSTFYKSNDGGQSWKSKKLPTTRWCNYLLIDPIETKIIYMGTRYVEQN